MSDTTRLDFTVPNDVFEDSKELIDENRKVTANSKTGKAYYGRQVFKAGLKKLKEMQEEKRRNAVDFREAENRAKNFIENKGLKEMGIDELE